MTKELLKQKLIDANKTRQTPRSDVEIDDILAKYEKSLENRAAMTVSTKSTKAKLSDIMKQFKPGTARVFASGGIGIFVKKNDDGTADVAFSFLNLHDAEADGFQYSVRETKYHAALNYTLKKYTYKVEWKGRSEFAIYDAILENKRNFPSMYKDFNIGMNLISPPYLDKEGKDCVGCFPIEF